MAITQPVTSEADADTLENTTDAATGIIHIEHGAAPTDTPKLRTRLTQQGKQIIRAITPIVPGAVFSREDGLNVAVIGIPRYRIGGTSYTLPDDNVFAVTDDKTMHLYCDDSQIVEQSDGAWPGTDHIKLAVVTTASGAVTSVVSALMENHTIGIDSEWSTIAATQEVDMGGFGFEDLGPLKWEHADATIATGVLAVGTAGVLSVKGEGDAADDLDTITTDTGDEVRFLLIRPYDAGSYAITVKHETDNIHLAGGTDCALFAPYSWLLLAKYTYAGGQDEWGEIARNAFDHYAEWASEIDANGYNLKDLGMLSFEPQTLTLASGAITLGDNTSYRLFTEGGGSPDDLDEIDLGSAAWADALNHDDGILILRTALTGKTVTVKHDNAGVETPIILQNGLDFAMSTLRHTLVLRYDSLEGEFVEIARSPQTLASLEATEKSIPYPIQFRELGALVVQAYETTFMVPIAGTIRAATGYVDTAPTGGPVYIDVQLDSGGGFGSIFAAGDANKIHIADGTNSNTATVTPWTPVAAGDRLKIVILTSVFTSADLGVMVDFRAAVQAPE